MNHTFRQTGATLDNVLQGNLGEFIGFAIGQSQTSPTAVRIPFPSNAFTPLATISKPEIDIFWLHFGSGEHEDFAVIQEVKTTVQQGLSYATELIADYDKLFGTNIALTLWSRIDGIKNQLEYQFQRMDLIPRLVNLAGNSPKTCTGIRLLPTLLHDLSCKDNPVQKLTAIRTTLAGKGWKQHEIHPWSIALSDLAARLLKLATGTS